MNQPTVSSSSDKRSTWPPALVAILGFLAGVGASLLAFLVMTKEQQGKLQEVLYMSLRSASAAIITTLFTFFFIKRFQRHREKEADRYIIECLAELEALVDDFKHTYNKKDLGKVEDHEATDQSVAFLFSFEPKFKEKGTNLLSFANEEFLFRLRGLPAVYKGALGKLQDIFRLIDSCREILPTCSAKFAAPIPTLLQTWEKQLYAIEESVEQAFYAYERLHSIFALGMLKRFSAQEFADLIVEMYVGVREMYTVENLEEAAQSLQAFVKEELTSDEMEDFKEAAKVMDEVEQEMNEAEAEKDQLMVELQK